MRVLHHLEQSRSFRILWAMEELGLDYEVKYYKRQPNLSAPPALKQIHPLGKAPILVDQSSGTGRICGDPGIFAGNL